MGDRRCGFFQQSEPFAADRSFESGESGESTTGSPQILHKARTFRIGHQHEDNRNAPVSYGGRGWSRPADDKIGPHCDDLIGSDGHLVEFCSRPTIIEFNITAWLPAELR